MPTPSFNRRIRAPRWRRAGAILVATTLAGVLLSSGALAVHDLGVIELDANQADDGAAGTDWGAIFDEDGNVVEANLPAGTLDTTRVERDFVIGATGPDPSFHEPSNHDQQAINPAADGTWGCVSKGNPVDKNDLVNAYAMAVDVDGDLIVYFGVERFDNSGTAFIGVWLFQDEVGCDLGAQKFTGSKTSGDILLLANFTNGGTFISLEAWEWIENPVDPDNAGTFNLISDDGVDCDTPGLVNDDFCANVNLNNVVTTWPMEDKTKPGPPNPDPANTLEIAEFMEGGINLTDLYESLGRDAPECFGTFMAESRTAAQLLSANLTDIVFGDLQTCFPDVHVAKSSSVSSIGAGGSYDYTVTATNDGSAPADDVVVTDDLDDSLTVNTATFDNDPGTAGGTGNCTVGAGNTIECEVGDLAGSDGNTTGAEPDTATVTINVTTTAASCPNVANTSHVTAVNEREEDSDDNDSNEVVVTVQCGAIEITKTAKNANFETQPQPLAGVTFTISGGSLSSDFVGQTDANGKVCVDGLAFGDYTVSETEPAGYHEDPNDPRTVTVDQFGDCTSGAEQEAYSNAPLGEIEVLFRSLAGEGVLKAFIDCEDAAENPLTETEGSTPGLDETFTDLEEGTYTCTIVVDP